MRRTGSGLTRATVKRNESSPAPTSNATMVRERMRAVLSPCTDDERRPVRDPLDHLVRPLFSRVLIFVPGTPECEHLEQEHAEREDVASRVDVSRSKLLRRRITKRAEHAAHGRRVGRVLSEELGDPEIEDLHVFFADEHQVAWFEIAMNHASTV